jgi:hypothetical protein
MLLRSLPNPHPTITSTNRLIRHHEHRHKTETPTTHAIMASNNHNKHLIMQHVPKAMMEKLPRVTLA